MTEERLVDLEIRQTFLERTVEELDSVVRDLNLEVQKLHREIDRILQFQQAAEASEQPRRLEDEVPPHY